MSLSRLYRLSEGPTGIPVFKRMMAAKFPHFDELLRGWVKYAKQGGMEDASFYIEDEGYANWGSKMTPDDVKMIQHIVKAEAGITEAGTANEPLDLPKKKKRGFGHKLGSLTMPSDDGDDDDLGIDMDYDDPSPPEEPAPKASKAPHTEKEPEKPAPFAAKSAPPSKALQGGKTAGSVKADTATLEALQNALESVRTSDDDLQDWIDDVIREIGRAVRSGGDLTLPKFEATPNLDDFDDDGGSEDEDY